MEVLAPRTEAAPIVEESTEDWLNGLRVLVVEDNPTNQRLMIAILGKSGHRVCVAGSGEDALELARHYDYDIVILDILLADMDGYEGLADHDVLEQAKMTRVLRTQIDVVLDEGAGVLNADIAQVAELAPLCDGEVLLYSTSADNAAVAAAIATASTL
mgnify:CR=1 FL=1